MPVTDHGLSWSDSDVDDLGEWMVVLASLADDAAAEAVGADVAQRADHALLLLRVKADRAGFVLNEDIFAQARTQFLADFLD